MKFYHVDRVGKLTVGQHLTANEISTFNNFTDGNNPEYVSLLENLFANSLSNHGMTYCTYPITQAGNILEWIYETIRLRHFSDRPSRFQSVFAFLELGDATSFINRPDNGKYSSTLKLWEVEGTPLFIGDMKLLHNSDQSGLLTISNAYNYWSGNLTPISVQEVLLNSFKVLQQVDLSGMDEPG